MYATGLVAASFAAPSSYCCYPYRRPTSSSLYGLSAATQARRGANHTRLRVSCLSQGDSAGADAVRFAQKDNWDTQHHPARRQVRHLSGYGQITDFLHAAHSIWVHMCAYVTYAHAHLGAARLYTCVYMCRLLLSAALCANSDSRVCIPVHTYAADPAYLGPYVCIMIQQSHSTI